MNSSMVERSAITLSAELRRSPDKAKAGQFSIVGYTGAEISAWFGGFIIDVAGVQVKDQTPVLREHARDRIVGWSSKAIKDGRGLVFEGAFTDTTEDGREALALARDGFPWQASVGIVPRQILKIKKEENYQANGRTYNGPLEIWSASVVGEVSLVAWGADSNTSMQLLSAGSERVRVPVTEKGTTSTTPRTFLEAVDQGVKRGLSKSAAIRECVQKYPQLHQDYLQQANR
jgi:hypothetical protein